MRRRYYILNIRHAKGKKDTGWRARAWLQEKQFAPIFYGDWKVQQILDGATNLKKIQAIAAEKFLRVWGECDEEGCQPVFVTIDEGRIWLYEPVGQPPQDGERVELQKGTFDIVKGYKIRHLPAQMFNKELKAHPEGIPTGEVPLILSSMKANQAFCLGTFTEIGKNKDKYRGNIAAIKYVLAESGDGFKVDPLLCLSSVELETLIAKLYEAKGCFVPASRGGVIKDVDLYAYSEDRRVANIQIKLSLGAQKGRLLKWLHPQANDERNIDTQNILVTLDANDPILDDDAAVLTRKKIHHWLQEPEAADASIWLNRSLDWLPKAWQEPTIA